MFNLMMDIKILPWWMIVFVSSVQAVIKENSFHKDKIPVRRIFGPTEHKKATDIIECVSSCINNLQCENFIYNKLRKECIMYNKQMTPPTADLASEYYLWRIKGKQNSSFNCKLMDRSEASEVPRGKYSPLCAGERLIYMRLFRTYENWYNAQKICKEFGGLLARPNSDEDHKSVINYWKKHTVPAFLSS